MNFYDTIHKYANENENKHETNIKLEKNRNNMYRQTIFTVTQHFQP